MFKDDDDYPNILLKNLEHLNGAHIRSYDHYIYLLIPYHPRLLLPHFP